MKQISESGALNTDREIWREREGDFYADSIHVTEAGAIGINCGGIVFVLPVRGWHALASADWKKAFAAQSRKLEAVLHIPGVKEIIADLKWDEQQKPLSAP